MALPFSRLAAHSDLFIHSFIHSLIHSCILSNTYSKSLRFATPSCIEIRIAGHSSFILQRHRNHIAIPRRRVPSAHHLHQFLHRRSLLVLLPALQHHLHGLYASLFSSSPTARHSRQNLRAQPIQHLLIKLFFIASARRYVQSPRELHPRVAELLRDDLVDHAAETVDVYLGRALGAVDQLGSHATPHAFNGLLHRGRATKRDLNALVVFCMEKGKERYRSRGHSRNRRPWRCRF